MRKETILILAAILLGSWFSVTFADEPPSPSPQSAIEPRTIKAIAFDLFGTLVNLQAVDRSDVQDYIRQVRRPQWEPLQLPADWERLPAFPDSAEGIRRLRTQYIVVTCSNAPLSLQVKLLRRAGIEVDAIIPLETVRAYKPQLETYQQVASLLGLSPSEVLMVSGNEGSPDLVAPAAIGMPTQRIRGDKETPQNVIALADRLLLEDQ